MEGQTYLNEQWDLLRPKPNTTREKGVVAGVVLQRDEIELLDKLAGSLGMSRSEFLRASFLGNAKKASDAGFLSVEMATPV